MPELVIYENGEFTDLSRELPLTEEQVEALEKVAHKAEEHDDYRCVQRIIIDMDY